MKIKNAIKIFTILLCYNMICISPVEAAESVSATATISRSGRNCTDSSCCQSFTFTGSGTTSGYMTGEYISTRSESYFYGPAEAIIGLTSGTGGLGTRSGSRTISGTGTTTVTQGTIGRIHWTPLYFTPEYKTAKHSKVNTTLDIYTHTSEDERKAALNNVRIVKGLNLENE